MGEAGVICLQAPTSCEGLASKLEIGLEVGPLMGSSYLVRHIQVLVVVGHTESVVRGH
jgi:hypothetical protein